MLSPEDLAIFPWAWTSGERYSFQDMRDCGFNLAGFVAPELLDRVREAGLKCLVGDSACRVGEAEAQLPEAEIERRTAALVKRVAGHEAALGYYLRDEPGASVFPGLGKWVASYRKADPRAIPFVNLYPNYASPEQLGCATYAEHLESFIQTVRPSLLCYDHYALMDDGTLRQGYFPNLEAVRAAGRRHGLPFWNVVLANAHFNYAEPSAAGLRFQMYTSLAYGARGLGYFTYFSPTRGNYRLAPIDQHGHKTPTWDLLRDVNLQMHRLGPLYAKLKSVNVFHHPEVPPGCSGSQTSSFLSEIRGGSLLVGEFEGPEGQPFALVANKSLRHSTTFRLKFKQPGQIRHLNSYTGTLAPWDSEDDWLAAGQGMLLCLEV